MFGFSQCKSFHCADFIQFYKKYRLFLWNIFRFFCFSRDITFRFLSWNFVDLPLLFLWWSTTTFSFFNHSAPFTFAPNIIHRLLGRTNLFHHTLLWIAIFNDFYDPFHWFNWKLLSWFYVSSQLGMSNR